MREVFPGPRREGVSSAYPLTASSTRKRSVARRLLGGEANPQPSYTYLLWYLHRARGAKYRVADKRLYTYG